MKTEGPGRARARPRRDGRLSRSPWPEAPRDARAMLARLAAPEHIFPFTGGKLHSGGPSEERRAERGGKRRGGSSGARKEKQWRRGALTATMRDKDTCCSGAARARRLESLSDSAAVVFCPHHAGSLHRVEPTTPTNLPAAPPLYRQGTKNMLQVILKSSRSFPGKK